MNGWSDLAWLIFLLALGGWLVSLAIVRAVRGMSSIGSPTQRLRRTILLALMPLLVPLALVGSSMALALGKYLGWLEDHCPGHGGVGHPHLCFLHRPALELGPGEILLLGLVILLPTASLLRLLGRQGRTLRKQRALASLAGSRRLLIRAEHERPFAFTFGLRAPRICLSSALWRRLDRRQQRIVVAHEAAHVRGRDAWMRLFLELLLVFHLPAMRRRLRIAWHEAAEERADDSAAARFGRDAVAETLLCLARLQHRQERALAVTGGDPARRIRRLLEPEEKERQSVTFETLVLAGVLILGALLLDQHHAVETALGYLTGF